MTATTTILDPAGVVLRTPERVRAPSALLTLARRRAALTAQNPRQIAIPLLTPILFALVIAPALQKALGGLGTHIDYKAFVSIGTVGLLVPLTCVFAGLSVIVDRAGGAQRELLAAPVPRAYLVIGNLLVALALAALQVTVLIGVAAISGAGFHVTGAGVAWFLGAAVLFTVFMYGVAETLASRIPSQEEYIAVTPGVAVLPFFFAGALFPISALPGALTTFAKFLPLTHAVALMRYGFVDPHGTGLHDIWGIANPATAAWLSLGVVTLFACAFGALAIRSFSHKAVV
jgi:ABC-2 type transport system permease protein